jgi:hypothetical protein
MKRTIRLTESQLTKIIKKAISEQTALKVADCYQISKMDINFDDSIGTDNVSGGRKVLELPNGATLVTLPKNDDVSSNYAKSTQYIYVNDKPFCVLRDFSK